MENCFLSFNQWDGLEDLEFEEKDLTELNGGGGSYLNGHVGFLPCLMRYLWIYRNRINIRLRFEFVILAFVIGN